MFAKILLYIYIHKYSDLNDFIFHQYSTHSNLFIKLIYSIFCGIHAILYTDIHISAIKQLQMFAPYSSAI